MDWTAIRREMVGDTNRSILPPRVKLPVLPRAITEFSRVADDPEATPAQLGRIIETDSGLTCDLLRTVNSASYGLRSKAASAQHAIAMLGVEKAKLLLVSVGMKRAMRACESKLVNFQNFWATNLERGLLAREVAVLLGADPELAYAGGMLQDFLLPLVTSQMFPSYLRFATGQSETPVLLTEFEQKEFQWNHAEAAAHVMVGWGFPDDLVCCVFMHHHGLKTLKHSELGRTSAAAVAVAGLMPDSLEQVPDGMLKLQRLEQAWPAFDLMQIAERMHEGFEVLAPGFQNHFSFLKRCQKLAAKA